MRKIRVGKALLDIAELPSVHELLLEAGMRPHRGRRRALGLPVVRAPRPAGSGVGQHETWRCRFCREWVMPSRSRIEGCCHACDTPRGDARPGESDLDRARLQQVLERITHEHREPLRRLATK